MLLLHRALHLHRKMPRRDSCERPIDSALANQRQVCEKGYSSRMGDCYGNIVRATVWTKWASNSGATF